MTFEDLVREAITREGGQANLAGSLSIGESELSRRQSGQTGWKSAEIDTIIRISGKALCDREDMKNLIGTIRLLMAEERKEKSE